MRDSGVKDHVPTKIVTLKVPGPSGKQSGYFDRAPELELLRHLRNGVAQGNSFRIDNPKKLTKFPAHNLLAWAKSDSKAVFEITPSLHDQPVLFDFMGPGDIS